MNASTIAPLCAVCLLTAAPAYTYIDPGTGGMLIQLVTGGAAGLLILGRLYWRRMKDALTGKADPPAPSGGGSGRQPTSAD